MLTPQGVKVLEFNARFGDPEIQVVLTRLETDLVDIMLSVVKENLDKQKIIWKEDASVCVVMSAEEYPGEYVKVREISFKEVSPEVEENSFIFHAGTKNESGKVLTSGGRVSGVTALGGTIEEAIKNAYKRIESVTFEGAHYRKDIGKKL